GAGGCCTAESRWMRSCRASRGELAGWLLPTPPRRPQDQANSAYAAARRGAISAKFARRRPARVRAPFRAQPSFTAEAATSWLEPARARPHHPLAVSPLIGTGGVRAAVGDQQGERILNVGKSRS